MRLSPFVIFMLVVSFAACSSKSQNQRNGGGSTAGGGASETIPDDEAEGPANETPPATNTADTVKISGSVQVPDDDLTPISPASSTLWLSQESLFSVTCKTLGTASVSCNAPVIADNAHSGNFSMDCPGAGADTLACYLNHGKRKDTILFDELPTLTVGIGSLSMNISTAGAGVPVAIVNVKASTALAHVDADLAAAKASKTIMPPSTGTWSVNCDEPAGGSDAEDPCVGVSGERYFVDYTAPSGVRTLSDWATKADYESCMNPATNQPNFGLRLGTYSAPLDFHSTASFTESMNAFIESLPSAVFASEKTWMQSYGAWGGEHRFCATNSSNAQCGTISAGKYAGLTYGERDALIGDVLAGLTSWSDLEQIREGCAETTPADVAHCVGSVDGGGILRWHKDRHNGLESRFSRRQSGRCGPEPRLSRLLRWQSGAGISVFLCSGHRYGKRVRFGREQ